MKPKTPKMVEKLEAEVALLVAREEEVKMVDHTIAGCIHCGWTEVEIASDHPINGGYCSLSPDHRHHVGQVTVLRRLALLAQTYIDDYGPGDRRLRSVIDAILGPEAR